MAKPARVNGEEGLLVFRFVFLWASILYSSGLRFQVDPEIHELEKLLS
jgi:hypothetical protein